MNILFVGDVVGKVGRKALTQNLNFIQDKYDVSFTIVNGENITNGRGMIKNHYLFLKDLGVDCVTLGNHYKDKDEIKKFIGDNNDIIRPLNLLNEYPGNGTSLFDVDGVKIRVTNLLGSAFMNGEVKDIYDSISSVISEDESDIHIIDFHAEATGEKKAFAYSLKSTVTAVIGTHTHVQTRDAQILNTGVAYISDVGMCGSYNSVLGDEINSVVNKIIHHDETSRFKLLDDDDSVFSAVVINVDDFSFTAKEIIPIYIINKKG